MKILNWIIALCGLWEFGDIAAVFVPGFGRLPVFLWNHIIAGLVLMILGAWAVRTRNAGAAKTMDWIAAAAGVWLIIAAFIFGPPANSPGLWNDVVVGLIVFVLGVWAALALPSQR